MSEQRDIVERLRDTGDDWPASLIRLEMEAADEIERLRKQLENADVTISRLNSGEELQSLLSANGEMKMVWWIQPLEIADKHGKPTGRWRMTAKSDEGGGGPFGDTSHDHPTAEEAQKCDACDEYVSRISGFPSRKRQLEMDEQRERKEYERLKEKFEP